MSDDAEAQWQVAWFPPDKPDQERVMPSERWARRCFAEAAESGYNPILSNREVGPWTIVANAAIP